MGENIQDGTRTISYAMTRRQIRSRFYTFLFVILFTGILAALVFFTYGTFNLEYMQSHSTIYALIAALVFLVTLFPLMVMILKGIGVL